MGAKARNLGGGGGGGGGVISIWTSQKTFIGEEGENRSSSYPVYSAYKNYD